MFVRHNCKVTSIWYYPVKSLAGQSIRSAELIDTGVRWDRSFMIIDKNEKFITQRDQPILNQISAKIVENDLLLTYSDDQIQVDHTESISTLEKVDIWSVKMKARIISDSANTWLSSILGREVQLVAVDSVGDRVKAVPQFGVDVPLSFTDGYPIHIVNQASIDELGYRLGCKLDVRRFRPNIIVEGLEAFSEDHINIVTTPNFKLQVVKPASRCVIPNINPDLGITDINVLDELASFRKKLKRIEFGIYAYVVKRGKAFIDEDLSITFK